MKILVINPGSTIVKFSLFEGQTRLIHDKVTGGFSEIVTFLKKKKLINSVEEIEKFGIRIVHGGALFPQTQQLKMSDLKKLKTVSDLAPLHNPPAVKIISQIWKQKKDSKIYGIFDTTFHRTIPEFASFYALPKKLSQQLSIKKYGFHGTACRSVLTQVPKAKRTIICHLGGGCSVTAVSNGKSVETSMGLTPLEGLIMISRTGDIDPGVIEFMSRKLKKPASDIFQILNYQSGIIGLTGTSDMARVVDLSQKKNKVCELAVNAFVHRVVKYIWAYTGVLGGVDLITFSGGIGEGSFVLREKICEKLKPLGIQLDKTKNNKTQNQTAQIGKKVWVVSVEEDREILREIQAIKSKK